MNGNRGMEMYYNSGGYPYQQVNESSYMGFFDGYVSHPPAYAYTPLPMHTPETAYWCLNNNSYRSDYHDGRSTSYYGYQVNHALPRTEINRRTWEYSSSMHIEEPTMDMQSEENVATSSDAAEECPVEPSETATPQAAWEDDIDPDNMTYEELLDLGEAVGTQSRGLSEELIKLLPTSRYKAGGFFSRKKSRERCVICLVTYKMGDQQMTLPCKHVYHSKCGRKWLSINKTCPVCNSEVFGGEGRT
ncbi:E3 ubiquitin-protein ligase BIG BROTHER-like isoform X1 [Silene latifolia]|uniref:E3 ubiquitin-protein ligase BIG BROTHER-like isoform X1 n=1 Tax=Silene latifolia TaxID=37657 RepID=UPI003D76CCC4